MSSNMPTTSPSRALLRRFLATISVGAAIALVVHLLRRRLALAPTLATAEPPAGEPPAGEPPPGRPPAGEPPAEPSQPLPARVPPPVTRLASRRGSLVSPDAGEPWKLKGRYAAFLSHYKVSPGQRTSPGSHASTDQLTPCAPRVLSDGVRDGGKALPR